MNSAQIIPLLEKNLPADCFIYKHSTRCNISADAAAEIRAIDWQLPLYWINVIEERPMSDWVEEHFRVTHASPQLLFIKDGKVAENLTHTNIKAEKISGIMK